MIPDSNEEDMKKPFQITAPGFYRQQDGGKAEVKLVHKDPDGIMRISGINHYGYYCTWVSKGGCLSTSSFDLVAPWTEPSYRPYTLDEIQVGWVVCGKNHRQERCLIVAVGDARVALGGSNIVRFPDELLRDFDRILPDGSREPMGVREV